MECIQESECNHRVFPVSACPKIVEFFWCLTKVELLSRPVHLHATHSGLKCSPGSAWFTFLTQPVAPAVKKGREPPNRARRGARDGLENSEKNNRPKSWFRVRGGTVSAEHLYLTSIHPCSPCVFIPSFHWMLSPILVLFLCQMFCVPYVRVSTTDGWLWVVWGFDFFILRLLLPLSPVWGE